MAYERTVPPIGKFAAARLTLDGAVANVPELIVTLGVDARSWATTKYWITSPTITGLLNSRE